MTHIYCIQCPSLERKVPSNNTEALSNWPDEWHILQSTAQCWSPLHGQIFLTRLIIQPETHAQTKTKSEMCKQCWLNYYGSHTELIWDPLLLQHEPTPSRSTTFFYQMRPVVCYNTVLGWTHFISHDSKTKRIIKALPNLQLRQFRLWTCFPCVIDNLK